MQKIIYKKEVFQFSLVYLFCAIIQLRAKLAVTPAWFNGKLEENHSLLLQFLYTNNEQSRLLQFGIPEFFHRFFGLTIVDAYILQRVLFTFAAFVCFHVYLRKWFDRQVAFAGVIFLAAIMPLTYYNHLQESAPMLLLTFLLTLWAIRERRVFLYVMLLVVGALNNETVLILSSVYFFYNIRSWRIVQLCRISLASVATCLPAFAVSALMRYVTRERPHLGGAWHLPGNLVNIADQIFWSPIDWWRAEYLYVFLIFGAFWFYAFCRWNQAPLFLKRASLMIPLFITCHMLTGIIREARQMLPLSFIVIPLALCYLFPRDEVVDHVSFNIGR